MQWESAVLIFGGFLFTILPLVPGAPFNYYPSYTDQEYPGLWDNYELNGDFRNLGFKNNGQIELIPIDKRGLDEAYGDVKRNIARIPKVDLGFSRGHSGSRLASYGSALLDAESPLGPGRRRRSA